MTSRFSFPAGSVSTYDAEELGACVEVTLSVTSPVRAKSCTPDCKLPPCAPVLSMLAYKDAPVSYGEIQGPPVTPATQKRWRHMAAPCKVSYSMHAKARVVHVGAHERQ